MAKKIGLQGIAFFGEHKPFQDQIEKIRSFGVDFVEIKPHYHPDINYLGQRKGKIYFKKKCMSYIKECCQDLKFQLHFRDIIQGNVKNLCTGDKDIIKFILNVAEGVNKYSDDFVLITHLMYAKKGYKEIPIEEAMENARKGLEELYKNWDFSGKLALETMMEPFVYQGAALLGYKPEHLESLLEGKHDKFGICIDTGHLNKGLNNVASLRDFIHLPVYEVHFHGNYSHIGEIDDRHTIPSKETLEDYDAVKDYLKGYEGMINLEVKRVADVSQVKKLIASLR